MPPSPGPLPVATITLPDGTTLTCTVTGRRQAPDRTWWYQLTPAPGSGPPEGPAEHVDPAARWPPPPTAWKTGPLGRPDSTLIVHRGGCWLPATRTVTADEARALLADGAELCTTCEAEEGLHQPSPAS